MSRQKQNGNSDRLMEIISRVDSSSNTNRLKLLEPPQPIQQMPAKK
ncbi:hypothetical protein F7734_45385 [Scytonema sp. UIC 10036]|nr:hypothetical protein [Scytonema sp. UIC 10036]MUG99143.1 hypothetical protein [Scytonema sp. UIC 10036]